MFVRPANASQVARRMQFMSKLFILMLFGSLLAIPAAAQTGQQSGAGSANPLSTWLRNAYMGNRNTIVRSAEKMPEENYGMRPGTQLEVRTFGQRSEERRVGEEGRSRWSPDHLKKKKE